MQCIATVGRLSYIFITLGMHYNINNFPILPYLARVSIKDHHYSRELELEKKPAGIKKLIIFAPKH
jgi:hypothetical protein